MRNLAALRRFRALLGARPRDVDLTDVRRWITQHDEEGTESNLFRAVARVQISAPFGTDLRGVSVIDLPGLGDTNLSDSKRMLTALSDEIDVVVVVRRPNADGDSWKRSDVTLYDAVADALPGVPMAKRSFLVLNHHRARGNFEACERFAGGLGDRRMVFGGVEVTDAASNAEVGAVFDRIVQQLISTAPELDEHLLGQFRDSVATVLPAVQDVHAATRSWRDALAEASPRHAVELVRARRHLHEELNKALTRLLADLERGDYDPDEVMECARAQVLARARTDTGLPTVEQVQDRIDLLGTRSRAYAALIDEGRAHLGKHFAALEPALDETMRALKRAVVERLGRPDSGPSPRERARLG